jgi:tetratricopeptide (TPR) repeat protein
MSKRKRKQSSRRPASRRGSSAADRVVRLISYQITWGPLEDNPSNALPPEVESQADRLYHLTNSQPAQAIPELQNWIERYPDVAKLSNFLCAAYQAIGDEANAERIARENYRRHPDYLFAKLNYASSCIQQGNLDEIPAIFNNKYDLSMLYPGREVFHITEFVGFMSVMVSYFLAKGDEGQARVYYKMLQDVAPDHPATRSLSRRMEGSLLVRALGKALKALRKETEREK